MMVRIYQRSKTPTQSGRARTDEWMLEFDTGHRKRHDPLTGWIGSGDTRQQIKLTFPTSEAAIDYARRQGYAYELVQGSERKLMIQTYADNFR